MRILFAFLGILMIIGPPIYFGYRTYKQGYLKPFLKGAAWGLFGLAWVALAIRLLTRA